jgi:hypothetical protein
MATILVRIYRERGDASRRRRELLRRIEFPVTSAKPLTAARAARFVRKHFPEFAQPVPLLTPAEDGWCASRSVAPLPRCPYQFIWERAIISEAK